MTRTPRMAQTERAQLCDLALQLGADAPTLCEGWTVKDLVVHLLVREGSPAAVGIVLPPLAGLTDRVSRRLARRDLAVLVEQLRTGPPRLSPYAVPALDRVANTLEFFVHLEDVRRAQPDWAPRPLSADAEKQLWSMLRTAGKGLTRRSPVGVVLENTTTGSTTVLKNAERSVTVSGLPSELVLFVFGRRPQARVELSGDDADVAALSGTSLGI